MTPQVQLRRYDYFVGCDDFDKQIAKARKELK